MKDPNLLNFVNPLLQIFVPKNETLESALEMCPDFTLTKSLAGANFSPMEDVEAIAIILRLWINAWPIVEVPKRMFSKFPRLLVSLHLFCISFV